MKLSQSAAARCARVSPTQILRHVKTGKISVEKLDDGRTVIDGSELLRLYPKADLSLAAVTGNGLHREGVRETVKPPEDALLAEIRVQRDRLQVELDAERRQAVEERRETSERIDRLLRLVEEQAGQIKLLAAPPVTSTTSTRRPWWARWRA